MADSTPAVPAPQTPYERLFLANTDQYEILEPLGMIGSIDENNRLTFIDVAHLKCNPSDAERTQIKMVPPDPVYTETFDSQTKGSLAFFVASASLSSKERKSVVLTDVAQASLSSACRLNAQSVAGIAQRLPAAQKASKLFYVFGVTLSHLRWETYSEQTAGASISAGSWLDIGGSFYKSSGQSVSIPLLSVRGFFLRYQEARCSTSIEPRSCSCWGNRWDKLSHPQRFGPEFYVEFDCRTNAVRSLPDLKDA